MNNDGLLYLISGRGHRTRLLASGVAVWLTVSLVAALQPCCEIFNSLFEQHSQQLTGVSAGHDHEHGSTALVSGKINDSCGHGMNTGLDLTKVVPVIPVNSFSSPDGAAPTVWSTLVFAVTSLRILPSIYHSSPPPFRLYLRFLHLLI
jgi:hypothetical protein